MSTTVYSEDSTRVIPVPPELLIPYADSVVHITTSILPSELQLVLDIEEGIVTLLYGPPNAPANRARILTHQLFSSKGIRIFSVLLKSPTYCPFEYLLAALEAPSELIHTLLASSSVEDIPEFRDLVLLYAERIDVSKPGDDREILLYQMRRVMTEVRSAIKTLGLAIFTLRSYGFALQRVQVGRHTSGRGRNAHKHQRYLDRKRSRLA